MIRIVVAEDSPTARRLLVEMLRSDPAMQVVGEARTGHEAIDLAERLSPDLITMDVQMPELDGLEATREIMSRMPTPILIVSSLASDREANLSFEATRAGALTVLPKPRGPASPNFAEERRHFLATVRAMAQVKVVRRRRERSTPGVMPGVVLPRAARPLPGPSAVRVVAIAASTGGPPALRDILSALPPGFRVPILVTQHIAKGFIDALMHWLGTECRLTIRVAADGVEALPGHVYLAPDDHHLGVRLDTAAVTRGRLLLSLSSAPPVGGFRPAGTHLFESVAQVMGPGVLALILTGMGNDGVEGLRRVRAMHGRVLAQDEATSVIYGMPREAVRAGVVEASLPLRDIATRLREMVGSR